MKVTENSGLDHKLGRIHMALFDFITDVDLRVSLESDYKEIRKCTEVSAWKAVHVMAGSVIEAVLIDHILFKGHLVKSDALKLDLGKAIKLCLDKGTISEKSADLSSVIREYRNLIHPGRTIRLNEVVNQDTAHVALSVVRILLGEISRERREDYGYTAEQIVSKLERDPSAKAIISHLLKETRAAEIEQLMMKILPDRYLEAWESDYPTEHILPSLALCFRKAFDNAEVTFKKRVCKWLVSILKEGGKSEVLSFGTAFLRASDMKYMSKTDVSLVKEHLLSRLKEGRSVHLLAAMQGIGSFLEVEDTERFVDSLILETSNHSYLSDEAVNILIKEYANTSSQIDISIISRLDKWLEHLVKRGESNRVDIVERIKSAFSIDNIPF